MFTSTHQETMSILFLLIFYLQFILLCKVLISIFKGTKCENNHCPSIHPSNHSLLT